MNPLLHIGQFGTHVIKNPKGRYSFSGDIPVDIGRSNYETMEQAKGAFVDWYLEQTNEWQRDHIGNLRNDIFTAVMERKEEA